MVNKKERKQLVQRAEKCLQLPNIVTGHAKGDVIVASYYLNPAQDMKILTIPSSVGLNVKTYPGIFVPDTKTAKMMSLLNELNNPLYRGTYYVDEDGELCFRNHILLLNDGDSISDETLSTELFLGVRMFLMDMDKILNLVIAEPEEGEEEFVIEGDVCVG